MKLKMSAGEGKAVKLPVFDGTHKTFQIWWMRYTAYAVVHKFMLALQIGGEAVMPDSAATVLAADAAGIRAAAAIQRNAVAMATMTMAFSTEGSMGLVYKAITVEWPGGLAHIVVASLFKKYQPQDTITKVELRQMLNKVSMKKNDDPATLFDQISTIKNKYNTMTKQIDEDDLIAIILTSAPKDYQAILTSEQRHQGDTLSIEDLETVMNQHWRQIGGNKGGKQEDDDDNELNLSAFNGTCFNCGKKGHRSSDCRSQKKSKNGNGKKLNGSCNNCGKQGHKADACWAKEENKDKRPAWYKNTETGAAAISESGSKVEFLL